MSRLKPLAALLILGLMSVVSAGCLPAMVGTEAVVTSAAVQTVNGLPAAAEGRFRVGQPWTFANLSVYPLYADAQPAAPAPADEPIDERPTHGDAPRGNDAGVMPVSLQEALTRSVAVVRETGSVNTLVIENHSADTAVWIQAGDIVKGGRQDRTIAQDLLLPPRSGPVAVDVFCVEHGRWSGRSGEASDSFGA